MYGSKMKSEETDHLFEAILSLKDLEECYRFFDDLCTFSEIQAMTQRLQDPTPVPVFLMPSSSWTVYFG